MCASKNVTYVNISNPSGLNSSLAVKRGFAEVNYTLRLLEAGEDDKKYIPVEIIFCEALNSFFRITGNGDTISIEKLPITADQMEKLYLQYKFFFIDFDPITYQSFRAGQLNDFRRLWKLLFELLIPQVDPNSKHPEGLNLLMYFGPVGEQNFLFDFSAIFDLQYRFLPITHNVKQYVLTVGGSGLPEFAERLSGLFKPVLHKTVLLYGFDKHYSENALQDAPAAIRMLSEARPLLYEKLLSNAKSAGVIVQDILGEDDFFRWFSKGTENHMIQLLAHYRQSSGNKKGRLYFKHTSLRFDILEHRLDIMGIEGRLRNDIIIDAVTCTNFFDFRRLYSRGIKYMYLSHHDFDTDQAAFVLNEMYTAVNAKRLNYGFEYLNGKNHLHEARSEVYRCFFALAREGELITTP